MKTILRTIFLTLILLGPSRVDAQEYVSSLKVTERANKVPYKMVALDDPNLKEVWMDGPDDNSWWHGSDDKKYAKIASLKNDLGQDVLISIWVDREQCADMNCPMRIIVAGERIFNDQACRFEDDHTLSKARNSVFLCDFVIPLRTSNSKEK